MFNDAHFKQPCVYTINMWKRIGEKHLAQLMGERRVNLIFSTNTGWDVS